MLKTGVSYFGSRIQRHVREDMRDIREHNCNFVVHTFSETDLEFYKDTMKEFNISSKVNIWFILNK